MLIRPACFTYFQAMTQHGVARLVRTDGFSDGNGWYVSMYFQASAWIGGMSIFTVLLGAVSEKVMKLVADMNESDVQLKKNKEKKDVENIWRITMAADTDGSGSISREELQEAMGTKGFKKVLDLLDLADFEILNLYDALDFTRGGEIDIFTLISTILNMRGDASSIMLYSNETFVKSMKNRIEDLADRTNFFFHNLEGLEHQLGLQQNLYDTSEMAKITQIRSASDREQYAKSRMRLPERYFCILGKGKLGRYQQTLRSSFSAVSKPIFASKY